MSFTTIPPKGLEVVYVLKYFEQDACSKRRIKWSRDYLKNLFSALASQSYLWKIFKKYEYLGPIPPLELKSLRVGQILILKKIMALICEN